MISARVDLGDLYLSALKKPKEALDTYRAAIAVDPNHPGARYADKGKAPEAVKAFKKALELKKDFAGAADARQRLAALSSSPKR